MTFGGSSSAALSAQTLTIVAAVRPGWEARYAPVLRRAGATVAFVADGAALGQQLSRLWSVDLVILDLGLAVPDLAARLGPDGPRLLAFGEAQHAGLALAANLADFIADDPGEAGLMAAVDAAMPLERAAGVADISDLTPRGGDSARIAAALALLTPGSAAPAATVTAAAVRSLIRARRARERFLPADIFGDPAWDMLLDLTASRIEGRSVAVSSLCIAAAVPTTTALRWIRNLCDAGLFERRSDPGDARRAFIALSEPTAAAMFAYLATAGEIAGV